LLGKLVVSCGAGREAAQPRLPRRWIASTSRQLIPLRPSGCRGLLENQPVFVSLVSFVVAPCAPRPFSPATFPRIFLCNSWDHEDRTKSYEFENVSSSRTVKTRSDKDPLETAAMKTILRKLTTAWPLLIFLLYSPLTRAEIAFEDWVQRHNGPATDADQANTVAADGGVGPFELEGIGTSRLPGRFYRIKVAQ
jgi:hypothetical protein